MDTEQNTTEAAAPTFIVYDPWGWEEVPTTVPPRTNSPITIGHADKYCANSVIIGYISRPDKQQS